MFLDRNGYLEETFFTFSFSPIRDETGVTGLFHPVTETTSRMLAERRTCALRDLAAIAGKGQTLEEVCTLASQTLSDYQLDLPFLLFYRLDAGRKEARLIASAGVPPGSAGSPAVVDLALPAKSTWPLAETARSAQVRHVDDIEVRFGPLSCGEYPESQKEAMALPITPPGCQRPVVILVAGVSPRLPLNETYRAFYELLAAGVTAEVPRRVPMRRNASAPKPWRRSIAQRRRFSPTSATSFAPRSLSCWGRSRTNWLSARALSPRRVASGWRRRIATV